MLGKGYFSWIAYPDICRNKLVITEKILSIYKEYLLKNNGNTS